MKITNNKPYGALKSLKSVKTLGFDVGKANPAFAISEVFKKEETEPRLLFWELPKSKITNFGLDTTVKVKSLGKGLRNIPEIEKNNYGQVQEFVLNMEKVVNENGVDLAVIERFQNRAFGKTSGESAEFCPVIVGVAITTLRRLGIPYILIMASTWKTQFNNQAKLNSQTNNKALDDVYKTCNQTPHVIDASLMSIYGGMSIFEQTPFHNFRYNWIKEFVK